MRRNFQQRRRNRWLWWLQMIRKVKHAESSQLRKRRRSGHSTKHLLRNRIMYLNTILRCTRSNIIDNTMRGRLALRAILISLHKIFIQEARWAHTWQVELRVLILWGQELQPSSLNTFKLIPVWWKIRCWCLHYPSIKSIQMNSKNGSANQHSKGFSIFTWKAPKLINGIFQDIMILR